MPKKNVLMLLGRRDQPTDGVEDYSAWLALALGEHGYQLQQVRVAWADEGWGAACRWLWSEAARWRGGWALVQYTALSWSRRGFPTGFLLVLAILKFRGCRVGVVFHDPEGFPGSRWIDRARRASQHRIMRAAYALAEQTVHNVPVERVGWLPRPGPKAVHIPVGANVPVVMEPDTRARGGNGRRTVAVFGVTGGSPGEREVRDIARAVGGARRAVGALRLVVLGRGSREAEGALRRALDGVGVELSVMGILPAGEVSRVLAEADALLFVRGPLSSQRTSAVAGMACGLPVVGYSGPHTGPPLTEAGLLLAPYRDSGALAEGLGRVLSDRGLWQHLHERSVEAYRRHFSWEAIATRYIEVLGGVRPGGRAGAESVRTAGRDRVRVLLVSSHPVQYAAPLYRLYAMDPRLDVTVVYCSLQGAEPGLDPEFGVQFAWDVPLLDGYRWVHLPNRSLRPGLRSFFGLVNPGLWRLVRDGGFDVVVCYGYRFASFWIAALAAKLRGSALILTTDAHTLLPRDGRGWKVPVKRFLLPRVFALTEGVFAPSSRTVGFLKMLRVPADRIFLTPFVVDTAFFARIASVTDRVAARGRYEIPMDAPVALFSGKLVSWKRPGDLLEAAAAVDGLHLVYAGEGPLRAGLERLAAEMGLSSRVHFLGFVNQRGLPEVYAAADFLVLPSEHEPFGLVVNEAFACGRAAIVSEACGAVGDLVVDGETGFVVPVGDVQALADRIQTLAADPELRRVMGERARARIAEWGPVQNAETFARACLGYRGGRGGGCEPPGDGTWVSGRGGAAAGRPGA